jgi:putative acetyltransferase
VRIALRPYAVADEGVAIELWRRSWQAAYPHLDFTERLAWWRERWRNDLVPACTVTVAEALEAQPGPAVQGAAMIGFVTVAPATGYLDQIVVAPEAWGSPAAALLVDAAKGIAPAGLNLHVNQDNARAIRFYEKHGFALSGTDVNPRSGAPVFAMRWRP